MKLHRIHSDMKTCKMMYVSWVLVRNPVLCHSVQRIWLYDHTDLPVLTVLPVNEHVNLCKINA